MEELKILRRIDKIKASPDFERRVLTRIEHETAAKERLGWPVFLKASLAGAGALLLVGGIYLGMHKNIGWDSPSSTVSGPGIRATYRNSVPAAGAEGRSGMVPLLETVDYSEEMHGASSGARAVYLLEQVSGGSSSGIKF